MKFFTISGYTFEYHNSTEKYGGVSIYITKSMKYSVRKDIRNLDRTVEHLWIEMNGKNEKNSLLVAVFYQPS